MLSALLGVLQPPLLANETETRHAMAAMAAFAECKVLHAGYSKDRAQNILNTWIKKKGGNKKLNGCSHLKPFALSL